MNSERAANSMRAYPAIDVSILKILQEDVADNEPDVMLELIDIYIHDSGEHISGIAHWLVSEDFRQIEISAHSLKSSSATFGAMPLSRMCAQMEQAAKARQADRVREILAEVESEFAQVRAGLLVERAKWVEVAP